MAYWRSTTKINPRQGSRFVAMSFAVACVTAVTFSAEAQEEATFDPAVVQAAQKENALLIYSSVPQSNWKGVIDGVHKLFPWMKIEVLELGTAEVFSRYNIERSSHAESADILAANLLPAWSALSDAGDVRDLQLNLSQAYPGWAQSFKGVYTFSINPAVIAYNKVTVPKNQWPESLQDIATLVTTHPNDFNGKLTTYTPENIYGAELFYSWARGYSGDAWKVLSMLIPATKVESSGGTMLTKLSSGEYKIGYFLSGSAVRRSSNPSFDRLIGWAIPKDGVPIGPMSAAVMKTADSPNSASLFMQFTMSEAGQADLPKGGMDPVIGKVPAGARYFTYQSLADQVGKENVILVGTRESKAGDVKKFVSRWLSVK